jgi:anti-anti-sigma factor
VTDLVWLTVEEGEPAVVTQLDGEVDASNARQVGEDALSRVTNEAVGLVLDLSHVRYVDSAGIQMLFDLHDRLESRRQGLALVVPEYAPIAQMLTLSAVQRLIPVAPTRQEASAALGVADPPRSA